MEGESVFKLKKNPVLMQYGGQIGIQIKEAPPPNAIWMVNQAPN